MPTEQLGPESAVARLDPRLAELATLMDNVVARARRLTHGQWHSPAPTSGRSRAEVAMDVVDGWAVAAQELEGVLVPRHPEPPAYPAALPDLLAVVGHDLLAAARRTGDREVVTRATQLASAAAADIFG